MGAACLIGLLVAWIPASLAMPLGRDQGIFAWVGTVILAGGLPYADAWEQKGPGAHALYALALLLFGHHEWAIRLFDTAMLAAGAAAFITLGRRAGAGVTAGLVATALALFAGRADFWETAQPDGWAAVMLLWSVVLVTRPTLSAGASFTAFLLVGLGALVKPQYLLFGALTGLAILRVRADPSRVRLLAFGAAGAALPLLACFGIYLQAGRLDSIWEVLVLFNLSSHVTQHAFTLREFLRNSLAAMGLWGNHGVLVLEIVAAVGYLRLRAADPRTASTLAGASALALVIAISQNKFYPYHFLPYYTFVASLGGVGFAALMDKSPGLTGAKGAGRGAAGIVVVVLVVLSVTREPAKNAWNWWGFAVGLHDVDTYHAFFCPPYYESFCHRDVAAVAQAIAEATPPGSPIYLWGYDALVSFLADRPAASRFGFDYPVIAASPPERDGDKAELMAALARTRPLFIVVQENDQNNLMPLGSRLSLDSFPALKELIARDYAENYRNASFTAYRRRAL